LTLPARKRAAARADPGAGGRPREPLRGERVVVRPATAADSHLLAGWHRDPEVARFWDGETFTEEEIVERLRRDDVDAYVVESDGEPVGYLQAWFEAAACGLDMFLVPAARGRRLGPDAARTLARHLLDTGHDRVTADPYLWNDGAIRAWERAGFRRVEERAADDDHPHPWLLLELTRPPGGASAAATAPAP
jgi:aminoglycoside 6'-N-acetyltransferase